MDAAEFSIHPTLHWSHRLAGLLHVWQLVIWLQAPLPPPEFVLFCAHIPEKY